MNRIFILVAVLVLAGCSVESSIRNEIRLGSFTFMPSESDKYQYLVNIRAIKDIGYNTKDPAVRMQIIQQLLGDACIHPQIYDEKFIKRTNQPGAYLIQVSCQK